MGSGGSDQSGNGSREKWSDCGYVLEVESTGIPEGLKMGGEEKKRNESYFKIFSVSS